jgi:hypothetical protein
MDARCPDMEVADAVLSVKPNAKTRSLVDIFSKLKYF